KYSPMERNCTTPTKGSEVGTWVSGMDDILEASKIGSSVACEIGGLVDRLAVEVLVVEGIDGLTMEGVLVKYHLLSMWLIVMIEHGAQCMVSGRNVEVK
ncbi:hypothetical protein KI387_007089, partial [Taxus chinensis]